MTTEARQAVADALGALATETVTLVFRGEQQVNAEDTGVTVHALQTEAGGDTEVEVSASVQSVPVSTADWSGPRQLTNRRRFHFAPPRGSLVPKWIWMDAEYEGETRQERYAVVDFQVWPGARYMVCTGETTRGPQPPT